VNILFIAASWGGPPNGIDRYIMETTRWLTHHGHTCHLVYSRLKGDWLSQEIPFASSRQVAGLHDLAGADNHSAAAQLLQAVAELRPDIAFFHAIKHEQALTRLAAACPTIGMLHDYLPICLKDTRRFYFSHQLCQAALGWTCLARFHFIRKPLAGHRLPRMASLTRARKLLTTLQTMPTLLVASEAVKQAYVHNGFDSDQIQVLPLYTTVPEMDAHASYPREKRVLFVGRLTDRYKGADVLLHASALCRTSFVIDIVGDGSYLPHLRALAARLPLKERVVFHGWAGADAIYRYYRKASVFILPSLWAEPFGLVGLEALANATPVIAFDVGGVREWLHHGENGYLVPYPDQQSLAEKIDHLLADPAAGKKMGLAGREIVQRKFSADVHVQALLSHFDRCRENWQRGQAGRTAAAKQDDPLE